MANGVSILPWSDPAKKRAYNRTYMSRRYADDAAFRQRQIDSAARSQTMRRVSRLLPLNLTAPSALGGLAIVLRLPKPRLFSPEQIEVRRRIRSRLKNQRKRARRMSAGGRARVSDVVWLTEAQRGKCFYCFKKLGDDYHLDHFVPIARGGRNERGNLRLSCPPCNIAKSDLPPEQFLGLLIA